MIKSCPQYKYTLEEQKKRFPYFNKKDYQSLKQLRFLICSICKDEKHTNECPRLNKK